MADIFFIKGNLIGENKRRRLLISQSNDIESIYRFKQLEAEPDDNFRDVW